MNSDIRWVQRFNNFRKSLAQLTRFMDTIELNELEQQGLIQSFEYNHELAWKTQKDFLEAQGVSELYGSKNVAREAFKNGLIEDGALWLDMVKSRNLSSHSYDEEATKELICDITDRYYDEFCNLEKKFLKLEANI